MKVNQQLLQINRNFIICFIVSASLSAVVAQSLTEFENHLTTTITIITGYAVYFGIFSVLFYLDNKSRYKQMNSSLIKKEILSMISSFGIGEIIYLSIRWPSLYYFLEIDIEPYIASLVSEIIATGCYIFLKKAKTF
jgi:biotin transporter BioY